MKIDDTLLSHCRNIAFSVAPELRKRPLYICSAELFRGLDLPDDGCLGLCFDGRITHFAYRERIPEWTTPGPLIVLFGERIAADVNGDEDAFRDAVYGTLLHEVAHALPVRSDIPERDGAEIFDCELVRDWQHNKRQEADALPAPDVDATDNPHNADFVRVAVHLLARARLIGWSISGLSLFCGDLWHIPQPAHWVLVLMREIVELQGEPFAEILSTPSPDEFSQLWERCVNFHFHRQSICQEVRQ